MSIINRRNAVLGWSVWQVGKRAAKRKAKQAVPTGEKAGSKGKKIVPAIAAAGGALWFWRRRRSDEGS
jgi:MYXO-CTERM domain-containing protein